MSMAWGASGQLPPSLGWTPLVPKCWGAPAESRRLGPCHYCYYLSFR